MEAKYSRKRAVAQIKILAEYKATLADSDSDAIAKVPHNNNESTGVLSERKQQGKKSPTHKFVSITVCCTIRL